MRRLVIGGKDPKIRPHVPDYFGKSGVGERGIAKPTDCRRSTGEEPTEVENNASANETPKAQCVHAGKSDALAPIWRGMM